MTPFRAAGRTRRPAAPTASRTEFLVAGLLLFAGLLFALFVRIRLLDMPLERDEGEYAYAGHLILRGIPPYAEVANMKLPGTYYAYAAMLRLFGETAEGVHLGLAVWTTLSALLLFLLARPLFGLLGAAAGAAAFAVMAASPSLLGLAGHATHFVVLPVLIGCWLLMRPGPRGLSAIGLGGLAFGLAFLMKQQAAPFVAFGALLAATEGWEETASRRLPGLARRLSVFAAAAVLPYAALCLYLWRLGLFGDFWFWTVRYAATYATLVPLAEAPRTLWLGLTRTAGPLLPLWIAAGLGGFALAIGDAGRRVRLTVFGLVLFSFLAVCPGFYFRHHYFLVMLPALSLLIAAGVSWAGRRRAAAVAAVLLAAGFSIFAQRDTLFRHDGRTVISLTYEGNPFVEAVEIGRYLRENSDDSDRIAVMGSEPEIYFYARRRAATRTIYAYGLMEPHRFARRMQEEVIREIEESRPRFAVLVALPISWRTMPVSDRAILDWTSRYFSRDYDVAGLVILQDGGPSNFLWGDEAARATPVTNRTIHIMRRRDS